MTIEFYRRADCPGCANIEAALKEMVIAHKVIVVEPGQPVAGLDPAVSLPAMKDSGQVISGQAAIVEHLKELERFVENWRRFQADACYCDEDELLA